MLTIRRGKHTENFTILPNNLLRDDRLSYCARGVLGELLTRPSGWETNADALSERARRHRGDVVGEGRRGLRAAFAELETAGYMVRRKEKGEKGRFVTVLEVFDVPQDRGTAGGTSVGGTSVSVTSVSVTSASGTSSVRTEAGSSDEEDVLKEGTASSPAARELAADGGGGGVSFFEGPTGVGPSARQGVAVAPPSVEFHPQAEPLVAALDFRGHPPGSRQRQRLVALAAAALDAGWDEQDLKTYLDLGGAAVNSAAAVYVHRLAADELPNPAAFREAARRPLEGTDAIVDGWMQLAGRSGPHRPYQDSWRRLEKEAAAGIRPEGWEKWAHCGHPDCNEITRRRSDPAEGGVATAKPCQACHPAMRF